MWSIPLTPIDQIFIGPSAYPIEFIFKFAKGLNPDLLLNSLKETLLSYPPLRSTIEWDTKRNNWFFVPLENEPYFQVRSDLSQPLDSVVTNPGEPLLKVVLSQGDDEDYLGVSISHAVADGFSFMFFMGSWGAQLNGKHYPRPDHLRENFIKLIHTKEENQFNKINSSKFFDVTGLHWLPDLSREGLGEVEFFRTPYESQLPIIQSKVSNVEGGKRVSSNAILSAECLKQWVTLNPNNSEKVSLSCAVDLRQRMEGMLSSNYFGNAVSGASKSWLREEFHKLSLSQLAFEIHERVSGTNLNKSKEVLSAVDSLLKQEGSGVASHLHIAHPKEGIMVTNLSRLPLKNLDFGLGPPTDFSILTKAPNTVIVTMKEEQLYLNSCVLKSSWGNEKIL